MSDRPEINSILKQVEGWSAEDRLELAAELMHPVRPSAAPAGPESRVPTRASLGTLIGIANPQGRPFTELELDELRFRSLKEARGL